MINEMLRHLASKKKLLVSFPKRCAEGGNKAQLDYNRREPGKRNNRGGKRKRSSSSVTAVTERETSRGRKWGKEVFLQPSKSHAMLEFHR